MLLIEQVKLEMWTNGINVLSVVLITLTRAILVTLLDKKACLEHVQ